MDIQIPFIKKDAQVTITIGTEIISSLQNAVTWILQQHTPEEVEAMRASIAAGNAPEPWAVHASTITRLLDGILESAKGADMVEYRNMDQIVSSLVQ